MPFQPHQCVKAEVAVVDMEEVAEWEEVVCVEVAVVAWEEEEWAVAVCVEAEVVVAWEEAVDMEEVADRPVTARCMLQIKSTSK
jgi:hypothetical protein